MLLDSLDTLFSLSESEPILEEAPDLPTFWRIKDSSVRIGMVLLIQNEGELAFVKKARRTGYEHSDKWALPGGMLRTPPNYKTAGHKLNEKQMVEALSSRVKQECGLEIAPERCVAFPVAASISSYTIEQKDEFSDRMLCHTLVVPFIVQHFGRPLLKTSDSSISEVRWAKPVEILSDCAPANLDILARWLIVSGRTNELEGASLGSHARHAQQQCIQWTETSGLPFKALSLILNNWQE